MPLFRRLKTFRLRPAQYTLLLIGLVLVGTFAVGHNASAVGKFDILGSLADAIFQILNYILLGIIKLFALLTSLFVSLLVAVAQYNVFLNAPVVTAGWPIVRDLMNMVFIIALLIIAAGTVLRIENYRYNRLLGRLIVMALLVNFSNVITVFFIQFAQIVMLTFVNAFKDIAFGNFVHAFGLDKVLLFSDNPGSQSSQLAIFVSLLAGLIMMIVAFILTLALTVVLFVRVIALWILIILSPMAYALRVLPNTEKYASQWWQEFGRYVTVGPVLAFFLWLALAILSNQAINSKQCADPLSCGDAKFEQIIQAQTNNSQTGMQKLFSGFVTEILDLSQVMTFLVAIIFLMMGLKYAQSSGVAGGKFASKMATATVLTGTGIAALRDRTWEPMKGWVRNRQAARKAAIEERTQTLEAAGDRGRARFGAETGLGQALGRAPLIGRGFQRGTEKAGAAASEYERQRTARYARERGLKDWRPEDIEREMLTATDPRRRLAMMQELQTRGRLDLSNNAHDSAFETITRQLRLPEGERNKMREDILKSSAVHMSEADVRRKLNFVQRPEEQQLLIQRLEQLKALNGDLPQDRQIINALLAALAPLPGRLKEFEDGLKKSNPKLALATVYEGLGEHTAWRPQAAGETPEQYTAYQQERLESLGRRLGDDLQQGLIDAKALRPEDLARYQDRLRTAVSQTNVTPAFDSTQYAQDYLGNYVVSNFRTKEDAERVLGSMEKETSDAFFSGIRLRDDVGYDQRKVLADKGYLTEAFSYRNAQGQHILNDDTYGDYERRNVDRIVENTKKGLLSLQSLRNHTIVESLTDNDKVEIDDLVDGTKDTRLRQAFTTTLSAVTAGYNLDNFGADANFNDAEKEGRRQNKLRRALVSTARGDNITDEFGVTRNSLQQAYETNVQNAAVLQQRGQTLDRAIRTEGKNLSRLDLDGLRQNAPPIFESVVNNIAVRDVASIDDKNPGLSENIIHEWRDRATGLPLNNPNHNYFDEVVARADRNDKLAGRGR